MTKPCYSFNYAIQKMYIVSIMYIPKVEWNRNNFFIYVYNLGVSNTTHSHRLLCISSGPSPLGDSNCVRFQRG